MSDGWTKEKPYSFGDPYYDSLLEHFRNATVSIDLAVYIFSNDIIGKIFINALKEAAIRGVKTRVIVDGVGSLGWVSIFGKELSEVGIEYKIFNPLPWEEQLEKVITSSPSSGLIISRINKRSHIKLILIDEKIAFVGSRNITDVHSERLSNEKAWNDLSVELEGLPVSDLRNAFNRMWVKKTQIKERRKFSAQNYPDYVRLNDSRRRRIRNNRDLINRIKSAKVRVWVVGSYFVPTRSLLKALGLASLSGVDVKILVPYQSDVFFIPWIVSSFQYGLLKAGIKVYEYLPSMIHTKLIIIDDWIVVGSSNLNHRSIFHDLEIDVVLSSKESLNVICRKFIEDISKSQNITMESWKQTSIIRRMAGRILLLFRYFL